MYDYTKATKSKSKKHFQLRIGIGSSQQQTEELSRLQSMGSQKIRHNGVTQGI